MPPFCLSMGNCRGIGTNQAHNAAVFVLERETAAALARTMHGLDEETNEDDSG